MNPRVSFIMACRDTGPPLTEAIDSMQRQTDARCELIIVDDGSTDVTTCAILRDTPARVSVIRQQPMGVTHARNRGLQAARGQYVSFFDSDDRLLPDFVAQTSLQLDREPGRAFATFGVRIFGDEEWVWRPDRVDLPWLLHDCSVSTAALVRREAVCAVGGFDPAMEAGHEDWDLWLRLVAAGHTGTIVPEVLFEYRRRDSTRTALAERPDIHLALYERRIDRHPLALDTHFREVLWLKQSAILHELCQQTVTTPIDFARRAHELLAAQPELAFVTGGAADEPCTVESLLARPWLAPVPTLFRATALAQLGAAVPTPEESALASLELCWRALAEGMRGAALAFDWRGLRPRELDAAPQARARLETLLERHDALLRPAAKRAVLLSEKVLVDCRRATRASWTS